MKHQKMMTWVSICGTALAIFLVMSFFMTDQLATVEAAPEIQRSRMLYGGGFHLKDRNGESNSSMSYPMLMKMYSSLDGIELSAVSNSWDTNINGSVKGKIARPLDTKKTDANFWKLYDFNFISGKPYNDSDIQSDAKKVVITRSVARYFFSKDDAAGETIYLNTVPYIVSGVVNDVNPSFSATFANIFIPLERKDLYPAGDKMFGEFMIHLLRSHGVTEESIKEQMKQRYAQLNQELKKDSIEAIYHGAPHNSEHLASGKIFSNVTPDLSDKKRSRYITYFVLLLIPAINLSAMMRGRLRYRISEIGVRRAFGAKRMDIVTQLLGENLIVTLAGGLIGLTFSMIFMLFLSSYFLNMGYIDVSALELVSETPTVSMLFTWQSFAVALVVCFVLNLMSAFIPSWKASKGQPAEAISKSRA